MSAFTQYPVHALLAVGAALTEISDRIAAKSGDAFGVDGLAEDQQLIRQAVDDFRDEWEKSVRKLGENIGGFGELSGQIGTMAANFDDALAGAMRPAGGGLRPGAGAATAGLQ